MKSLSLLGLLAGAAASQGGVQKVVQLLGDLKKKVADELKTEEGQFSEFAQYCDDESATRQNSIKEVTREIENLDALIASSQARISTATDGVQAATATINTNAEELAKAKEIREKEKEDIAADVSELSETIDMLGRAKSVLERTMSTKTSFAQGARKLAPEAIQDIVTALGAVVDATAIDLDSKKSIQAFMQTLDGDDDFSLLQQPQAKQVAYESKSGGIIDTIVDMKDKAEEQLNAARKKEMESAHLFAMMEQELTQSTGFENQKIQEFNAQSTAAKGELSQAQGDLEMSHNQKKADTQFLEQLTHNCKTKAAEWEARSKSGADELKALQKGIDILSQKFAFPQMKVVTRHLLETEAVSDARQRAAQVLKKLGRQYNSFGLMEVAAATLKGGVFEKIRGLITDMINKLHKQAAEEADHHAFCQEEQTKSKKNREDKENKLEKHQSRLDKAVAMERKLGEQITELTQKISEDQAANAKMTQMRAEEKEEFTKAEKDLSESQVACEGALNVLREFYGGGAALLQQPGGPSTGGAKTDAGGMIIGVLEEAAADFATQLAEAKASEEDSASNYEKTMQAAAVAKATDAATLKGKEAEVKSLADQIQTVTADKDSVNAELDAIIEYIEKLRPQCEIKVETYEEKKAKREAEIAGLKDALEILSQDGGDAALVQKRTFLSRKRIV